MAIAKRTFLFLLVNILVLTTISITWGFISQFFGLEDAVITSLLYMSAMFGMGGAFISLFISKWAAKKMMGVQIIEPRPQDPKAAELVEMVHRLAKAAALPKMPEVGIYNSPEVNAFATGPSKSNSLVAVSSGLLQRMNREQVEGVIGHEIAHIANGDMVTMTLIQGVINTMVLFLARIIAGIASGQVDERARPMVHFALIIVLQIALSILGSMVVAYFSRRREFRADAGSARFAGREKMVSALRALGGAQDYVDTEHEALATLKITGRSRSSLALLLSTHPPIEERIRRLETARLHY